MRSDPKNIYLSQLRNKNCERDAFRRAAHQISHLLAHDTLAHLETSSYNLETPLSSTTGTWIPYPITLVPILRSGMAMLPVFLQYFPFASVGVMGLKRDEKTAIAHQYYCNMPPLTDEHRVIILDPMIATGGTAVATLDIITEQLPGDQITFVSIISAPAGVTAIQEKHHTVHLIIAGQDPELNDKKYIIPGLGDFGDRYFGTV